MGSDRRIDGPHEAPPGPTLPAISLSEPRTVSSRASERLEVLQQSPAFLGVEAAAEVVAPGAHAATLGVVEARVGCAFLGGEEGRDEAHARAFAESVMERASEDAPRDGEHDWNFEEELWTITRNR